MKSMQALKLGALAALALVLVSCSHNRAPKPLPPTGPISGPGSYVKPHRDGAPWWDVDVSRIADAVPMPNYGPVKANPYTVRGITYYPQRNAERYRVTGLASWYGTMFHGEATANGEKYDLYGMTAAHKTLPLPSYVRVTNLENGKSVIVRVNDRGPFYSDRVIDLSFAAAKKLGYADAGTARVQVEGIDPHEWWAQQGRPVPLVLATPQKVAQAPQEPLVVAMAAPIENYSPPANQHAEEPLVAPLQESSEPLTAPLKKNASAPVVGLYLQVGAFANPDAAELLKAKLSQAVTAPVFINSVALNQQTLYRVRLGPISTPAEVEQVQESVRQANLGQPSLVRAP
ncbi:MAG: septal ring lytic transglycosylase RlpA family protein [Pseudomonadaceae bacterium]|jgi:rare lipoprotein A|nr:septal ring lytic transglycosylase RlpA family protein [Pseudomonadaceae bacterium]